MAEHLTRSSWLPVSPEAAFRWHEHEDALLRLSPEWAMPKLVYRTSGIIEGSRVKLSVPLMGPFRAAFTARHTAHVPGRFFMDEMESGPFASWQHRHLFAPNQNGCLMTDRLTYALPMGRLGTFFGGRHARRQLDALFDFRHRILKDDLTPTRLSRNRTIVISGASGLVGRTLAARLRTAGHTVHALVRRRDAPGFFWNPEAGHVDMDAIETADLLLHLAGEPIGNGRWTPEKKARIVKSRVLGTRTLASAILKAKHPPEAFLSASAIGYYGNRMAITDETAAPGDLFISEVCRSWEEEALAAIPATRVSLLRIGVGLSTFGGALSELLPFFRAGLGGATENPEVGMSWISLEDLIRAIEFVLFDPTLSGPVNLTAPTPLSFEKFARSLADQLRRPFLLTYPDRLVRLAFGQMGEEVVLSGNYCMPSRLLAAGFRFRHPELSPALRDLLGPKG